MDFLVCFSPHSDCGSEVGDSSEFSQSPRLFYDSSGDSMIDEEDDEDENGNDSDHGEDGEESEDEDSEYDHNNGIGDSNGDDEH